MEEYPNFKEGIGGWTSSCEVSSLLDIKLVMWLTASYALALAGGGEAYCGHTRTPHTILTIGLAKKCFI